MSKGKLFIVSGPSGSGKSTLLHEVFPRREKLFFSVSATTREPREGEQEGVDYYYVSRERFEEMIEAGEFLEHAEYAGNLYGTPKPPVEERLESGCDVALDIETQGAAQVKEHMPEAVSVFIMPPSLEELERRLRGRGTESDEKIQKRLDTARHEIEKAPTYDFIVVNDVISRAAQKLYDIMEEASPTNNTKEGTQL